ncbi:hypothetical protein VTI74DRAFT_8829 [Chaetomium olivicolor]
MSYIHESSSFGVFCCIRCQEDYHNEGFTYGVIKPSRKSSKDDSKHTLEAIEALFEDDTTNQLLNPMSLQRTNSIEQWLEQSFDAHPPTMDLMGLKTMGVPEGNTARDKKNVKLTEQFGYQRPQYHDPSGYYEFHDSPSSCPARPRSPRTQWVAKHGPDKQIRAFRDSGLGFLEYVSKSSDDETTFEPFEEFSDRSSIHSTEGSPSASGVIADPLACFLQDRPLETANTISIQPQSQNNHQLLFEEEEGDSEGEIPWQKFQTNLRLSLKLQLVKGPPARP